MCLAAHGGSPRDGFRKCRTAAASPAKPGELLLLAGLGDAVAEPEDPSRGGLQRGDCLYGGLFPGVEPSGGVYRQSTFGSPGCPVFARCALFCHFSPGRTKIIDRLLHFFQRVHPYIIASGVRILDRG